jgi:hypothetical protein
VHELLLEPGELFLLEATDHDDDENHDGDDRGQHERHEVPT